MGGEKEKTKEEAKNKKNTPQKEKEEESLREIKLRIVGVGGGGGSIISGMSGELKKVLFAAVNTDNRALEEVTKGRKIKGMTFGEKLTSGLGTGMDPELGKRAAQEDIEEIRGLFKDQDITIFVSSLGGGTGSGSLPVLAQTAREEGSIVYGIFTLPFSFEGDKKMKIARKAIKETNPYLHAITILPNEKIFEIVDKNTPLKGALETMNKNVAESLEGLVETIYETGLINIDFADVRTVLESRRGTRKLTYMNTVEGDLEEGTQEIVKRAVSNPLYPYGIDSARGILFNITGGKDIGLTDVSSVSESISQYTEDDAKIIVGIMQKQKYKDKIRVSLLATGCGTDFFKNELQEEEGTGEKKEEDKKKAKKSDQGKKKKEEKKENQKEEDSSQKEDSPKEGITVVQPQEIPGSEENETAKEPETEEEKEIKKEEEKWEKPSFLRKFNKDSI